MVRILTKTLSVAAAALLLATTAAVTARAAGDPIFDAKGFRQNRDYFSQAPFEHIDTLTGGLVLSFTDLVLPGNAGSEVRFQRVYNSKPPAGWTFTISPFVYVGDTIPSPPGYLPSVVDAAGGNHAVVPVVFAADGNARWVATAEFWKYDRNDRVLYLPDGRTIRYDSSGRPIESRDAFGNRVTIVYSGAETRVVQHLGSGPPREVVITTSSNPDGSSWPVRMEFAGRRWEYAGGYQDHSRATPPVGPGWTYAYEGSFAFGNSALVVTTPFGGTIRYEFEWQPYVVGSDLEIKETRVVARRIVGGRGTPADLDARTWRYEYSSIRGPETSYDTSVIAPSGTRTRTVYSYSPFLDPVPAAVSPFPGDGPLLAERTVTAGVDVLETESLRYRYVPHVLHYSKAEQGQRTVTRGGRTYVTEYRFNPDRFGDYHRPAEVVERGDRDRTTSYVFDYGFPYGFDYFAHPPAGQSSFIGPVAQQTVRMGDESFVTSSTFDHATGFVLSANQYGLITDFTPDAFGNVASATKGNGTKTEFSYQSGLASEIRTAAHSVTRVINPEGTVASETQNGRTTRFEYDALFRIRRTEPPGGTNAAITDYPEPEGTAVSVSRGASRVLSTLDGFGRVIETANSVGDRTHTEYDAEGRKIFESYPFNDREVGTRFEYDGLGRLRKRTNPDDTTTKSTFGAGTVEIEDENGRRTTQAWECFGSPDDCRLAALTDADGRTWRYGYNALGVLTSVEAPDGIRRTWTLDDRNLLTAEEHPEAGRTTYEEYDGAGNLRRKRDARETVFTYDYDANDRLVRVAAGDRVTTFTYEEGSDNRQTASVGPVSTTLLYDDAGRLASRQDDIDGETFTTELLYDGNDNVRSLQYPSGREITYDYDSENRVSRVFDEDAQKEYARDFDYHPSGALVSYHTGNGIEHELELDPDRYWPRAIRAGELNLRYDDYDGVGNVRSVRDSRPGMDQTFAYDALNRLTSAQGPYGTLAYAYDVHGNRQSAGGVTYEYQPGTFRLLRQSGRVFDYDANGNMTAGPGATYSYTPDNQLESSTVDGVNATYLYDADGGRVAKTSGTLAYFLRGGRGELLTEQRPTSTRDYVYGAGRLLAVVRRVKAGAASGPVARNLRLTGGEGGAPVTATFDAIAGGDAPLRSAALWRASSGAACSVGNSTGCGWTLAGSATAPANTTRWIDATIVDQPPTGPSYVYVVEVADLAGNAAQPVMAMLVAPDHHPDPLAFPDRTGIALSTVVLSAIVPVTGITGSVPLSVTAGAYRICALSTCSGDPPFLTAASTITSGQYLQLRLTSGNGFALPVTTTVSVGDVSVPWSVTTLPATEGYAQAVMNDRPIGYWRLGETAGGIAMDRSGHDYHGAYVGGVALGAPGPLADGNAAARFNGLGGRAVVASQSALRPSGAVTLEAWIQPANVAQAFAQVMGTSNGGTSGYGFSMSGAELTFRVGGADGMHAEIATAVGLSHATWYHVVGTYDGAALRLYLNGSLRHSRPFAGGIGYGALADFVIGQFPTLTPGRFFNGDLDEVAVYDHALAPEAIRHHYALRTSPIATISTETGSQDIAPDPFAFADASDVAPAAVVSSNVVSIVGIGGTVPVSIAGGGAYRICAAPGCTGGAAFTTGPSTITNGQYLQLQRTASNAFGTAIGTTVTVGSVSKAWSVSTVAQDTTPDPFGFADQTGLAPGGAASSAITAITGITGNVAVSVSIGGAYRVCGDATCSANPAWVNAPTTLSNGQYLQLRLTASSSFTTTLGMTVTVGSVPKTWTVTTAAQDALPDPFGFLDQTDRTPGMGVSSNIVRIDGITGNVAVSVSIGGAYRLCADAMCSTDPAWVTAPLTIASGQYVQLRLTASSARGTAVSTTVTVGAASAQWTVTTIP